jgi:hypothetical protein
LAALGETIMPARSVSCAISGENGALRRADGERIDDLDLVDRRKVRLAERALHGHVALERELRRPRRRTARRHGISRRPQLDGDDLAVLRGLVLSASCGMISSFSFDVEQLVADRREHDAPT